MGASASAACKKNSRAGMARLDPTGDAHGQGPRPRNRARRSVPLDTPTDLKPGRRRGRVAGAQAPCLADTFALYLKTKNFHWHVERTAFSRLSPAPRRAGRADLRRSTDDIAERRAEDRRHDLAVHRADRLSSARHGQQRGLRASRRDAARADGNDNKAFAGEPPRRPMSSATSTTTSPPRA